MSLFKRPNWTAADIPDLTFGDDRLSVDIGFLGGEAHRTAFVLIFEKMLRDNEATLSDMDLISIDSKRPVSLSALGPSRLPARLATMNVTSIAAGLYDSGNDKVILLLTGPRGNALLGVAFDNPEFWFEAAA